TTIVTINSTPSATIHYAEAPYCRGINTPQKVSISGTPGGTYSASAGLSINAATGDINPALSQPGVYIVTYTIAAASPCPGYITSTTVEIDDSPVLTFATPVQSICSGGTAVFTPSSTVTNTTYSWSVMAPLPANVTGVSSGAASGPNPTISLSFTNTGTMSQTLKIRVLPTNPSQNPCPGTPYELTLTVNPIPAAPDPATVNFCMGDPATSLHVDPLPGTRINWYDNNLILLSTAPLISTVLPGQFTYYVSQSNGYGCESPKSKIMAIVNPTAKIISSSYTNPTTCGIPTGSIVLHVLDLNNNGIPNYPLLVHYDKF
ncbi:MAG: PKD-like domain-containing protein, partial [Chitinophaga rupis]